MTHAHSHSDTHTHTHKDDPTLVAHGHGHNHNHDNADHLHSHTHGASETARREELQVLTTAFVDGFRAAADKNSYLRLAHIPFQRDGSDGLTLHLVDARIDSKWQIGTASPAFAQRELVYLPLPACMISERETMTLTYVSLTQRQDIDIATLLADRLDPQPNSDEGHRK